MSLPVRPPTLPNELERAGPALLKAELAEAVTLDKPSEAFEVALTVLSFAFTAVEEAALAASDVVEAGRTGVLRKASREGRSAARALAADIVNEATWLTEPQIPAAICVELKGVEGI